MTSFAPYSICRMTDEGYLKVLAGFDTYEKADEVIDNFSDRFPFALVDIYSRSVMLNCEVVK